MTIAVVVESEEQLASQLAFGQPLAKSRQQGLLILGPIEVWAEDSLTQAVGTGDGLRCTTFDAQRPGAMLRVLAQEGVETLLLVRGDGRRTEALRRRVLQRASCEVVVWLPVSTEPDVAHVLVPMARGSHARAALRLALDLAGDAGRVTALYVEPDVGVDAERIGSQVLDGLVRRAVGSKADQVARDVVIGHQVSREILAAATRLEASLILLGASKATVLGRRLHGTVGLRVSEDSNDVAVAVMRASAPFTGRLRSLLEGWVLRAVPQLERDQRVSMFERVQSNSYWDFDFIAMMSMATAIAAIGLVQDSEPVVIGAMLVAPLMTPILGLGLALVHGNPVLGRHATWTVALGFINAFLIGLVLGWFSGAEAPTAAMVARNWPGVLDLIVAFIAGFAGAYATSRASLSAAVTGVAIAAALVPPIATSGLALALGEWSLAVGASLLFFTNMVAIAFASSLCLWIVGMRDVKPRSRANRISGYAVAAVVLGLGVWFALASPRGIPTEFHDAVRTAVGTQHRVADIRRAGVERGARVVVVHLAGTLEPSQATSNRIIELARPHFAENVIVRVAWNWERETGR